MQNRVCRPRYLLRRAVRAGQFLVLRRPKDGVELVPTLEVGIGSHGLGEVAHQSTPPRLGELVQQPQLERSDILALVDHNISRSGLAVPLVFQKRFQAEERGKVIAIQPQFKGVRRGRLEHWYMPGLQLDQFLAGKIVRFCLSPGCGCFA